MVPVTYAAWSEARKRTHAATSSTVPARRGVTVNAVAPGFVATELTSGLNGDIAQAVPARRVGTPEEVAACVRFLAGEEAAYVTGTTLTVDGGMSA